MERGDSSDLSTDVKAFKPPTSVDSGAWKAGLREGIMEGVRIRTDGFGPFCLLGCRCECERGKDVRSGKKACIVRIGVRRRVLRRSLSVAGERVAIGEGGYVVDGTIIKERRVRWWGFAP
jgi:hypothetical protein